MIGKSSIHTRMLLIIVSLIIVPKLILAIVGFLAARLRSLLICLAVCHTRWSHADHVGQNSSQNRQDVVRDLSPLEAV